MTNTTKIINNDSNNVASTIGMNGLEFTHRIASKTIRDKHEREKYAH